MTALSDLLTKANADKLSTRVIAKIAEEAGHPIDFSTVSLYLNGKHGEPDEPTLVALASALPVTLAELRKAAGLPHEEDEPYEPPAEAARLTGRQRRAVTEIIRLLVREVGEDRGHDPANTQAGASPAVTVDPGDDLGSDQARTDQPPEPDRPL